MLECMRGNAHKLLKKGGLLNGSNLQDNVKQDTVLPECLIHQNLANYTALSTLPDGV